MTKAEVLIQKNQSLYGGRFVLKIQVLKVKKGKKFPNGVKAKFVLLDVEKQIICLLIDNHEPWGYHIHPCLPEDHSVRVRIGSKDYQEAPEVFFREVQKVLKNETKKN